MKKLSQKKKNLYEAKGFPSFLHFSSSPFLSFLPSLLPLSLLFASVLAFHPFFLSLFYSHIPGAQNNT